MIEEKINNFLAKIGKFFIYLLIIYLPLYELVLHILQSFTALSDSTIFWLTHFYEPLIGLFILAYLIKFLFYRKWPTISNSDIFALGILLLSFLMIIIYHNDLQRSLQGLRFLILPFSVFIIARLIDYKNSHKLIQLYSIIASIMAVLEIIEYFLLPSGYMDIYYGIADFGFGQNSLINTAQATAILSGPNQLASYLLLPFFYLLHRYFASSKSILASLDGLILIIITLAIGLTYSRSALLGLLVGTIFMLFYFGKKQRNKVIYAVLFFAIAITSVISSALYNGELFKDLVTHGGSMIGHQTALTDSLKIFFSADIFKILFGFGVGSAGPIALKLGGIVSENYYLQVCFELGIVGFIVYLLFIISILRRTFSLSKTLFFSLIALLVNATFLHIFSDNPAMAVTVFIIIAVAINQRPNLSGQAVK